MTRLTAWMLVRPGRSPDDREWAVPLLTSIASATLAYRFGKAKA